MTFTVRVAIRNDLSLSLSPDDTISENIWFEWPYSEENVGFHACPHTDRHVKFNRKILDEFAMFGSNDSACVKIQAHSLTGDQKRWCSCVNVWCGQYHTIPKELPLM